MSWTFDESIVSDLHKDARGFRPGQGWWAAWKAMDDAAKQAEWDGLVQEMDAEIKLERTRQAQAEIRWTEHINQLMAANGISWGTALRWDMEAMDADGDVAYYCYRWDISYRNEAAITAALREMVPAGG